MKKEEVRCERLKNILQIRDHKKEWSLKNTRNTILCKNRNKRNRQQEKDSKKGGYEHIQMGNPREDKSEMYNFR